MNVLIVDDSVFFRSSISRALEGVEDIHVVGTAGNGKIAIDKLKKLPVDLITMDIEMPIMDGIETIKHIRKDNNKIAILVFSTLTRFGAKKTIEALTHGADDFLPKTLDGHSIDENTERIKRELVRKIKQFVPRFTSQSPAVQKKEASAETKPVPEDISSLFAHFKPKVICIGSSTGGPEALRKIFTSFRNNIGMPVLIAQHMPPMFTDQLAKMLNRISPMKVKEAENGEQILPNTCYVAPGDYHMIVSKNEDRFYICLHQGEKVNHLRPAVDVLFSSVAEVYGQRSLAIVLTGMGEDGLMGGKALKNKGVPIIIQDQESSVVWGMPGAIFKEGIQQKVLPLEEITNVMNKIGSNN